MGSDGSAMPTLYQLSSPLTLTSTPTTKGPGTNEAYEISSRHTFTIAEALCVVQLRGKMCFQHSSVHYFRFGIGDHCLQVWTCLPGDCLYKHRPVLVFMLATMFFSGEFMPQARY